MCTKKLMEKANEIDYSKDLHILSKYNIYWLFRKCYVNVWKNQVHLVIWIRITDVSLNAYVFLIIFWNIVLTQFMQILLKCTILFPFEFKEFKSFQVCKGFLWNRSCYVPNGFKVLLRNSKLRNCWSLRESSKIHMEDTLRLELIIYTDRCINVESKVYFT